MNLIPGSGGVLEVSLGERTIFSKTAAGRFPAEGEVAAALSEALGWRLDSTAVTSSPGAKDAGLSQ